MITLLMCLCLLQTHFVDSGVIFDKISSGFIQGTQRVSCGLHLISNKLVTHNHQNNPCNGYQTNDNNAENTRIGKFLQFFWKIINKKKFLVTQFVGSSTLVLPTKAYFTSTGKTGARVAEGKNLIRAGANCSGEKRGDGRGNCREKDATD